MYHGSRNVFVTAAAILVGAFALSGCGGDDSATPKTADGRPATIGVEDTDLGDILVDAHGHTLYLFAKDSGPESTCTGACASAWPPLRVSGKPTVGTGANSSLIGTTSGQAKPQVTYNGHPLYLFSGDHKAGDTNGQGSNAFGAGWYALSSSGDEVTRTASNSGGGYGY